MPSPVPYVSVETVAVCNFRCVMCPTLGMKSKDMGYMSVETFSRVLETVHGATYVELTGWGEPLLDENIFDRVKAVRALGPMVAFTSNASLLNAENRSKLFDSGLELLNISIDSSNAQVFNEIRELGDWSTVAENVTALAAEKKRRGLEHPFLRSTFVLMRSNAHTLCDWIKFMARIGFNEVCIKPLDVVWNKDVLPMILPPSEAAQYRIQAAETARNAGIRFIEWNFDGIFPANDCLVHAYKSSMYIDWRGNVSPCCNLGHTVERVVEVDGQAVSYPVESLVFGNINQTSAEEIWASERYQEFRDQFLRGEVPVECEGCRLVKPHAYTRLNQKAK